MASTPLQRGQDAQPGAARRRATQTHIEALPWREMDEPEAITEWDALAQWASCPNPFVESWYLLPALEAFDPDNRVSILRFTADGTLAGILPIARQTRYYRHRLPLWSNWTHANCFLAAPLVAQGLEKPFWRALFAWADEHARGTLFLHLAHMPLEGALYDAMRAVLAEQNRPAALVHRELRALLCSDLTPEEYLDQALTGKKRKELRRQYNRLSEQGALRFSRREDAAGIDQWIEGFLWLESSGWKGIAGSALAADPGTAGLFAKALKGAAARGRLERLTLSLDGVPIAMLANFITPPGAFSFKTAFDERYARFSPGVLLQRENLTMLEHEGVDWCDSCASADHPMIDHLWRERRAIGRINIGIGGPIRRAVFRAIAFAEKRGARGDIR